MFSSPNNYRQGRLLAAALLALAVTTFFPTSSARGAIADSWSWPVEPPWHIEHPYLAPPTPYGVGHRGIDLRAAFEARIFAPAPGIVLYAGIVVDRGVLSIDHGNGVTSSYEPVTAAVVAGQKIKAGDVIGFVSGLHTSPSGSCACLHLGAKIYGEYLSPLAFLATINRAVLLPWRD